MTCRLFKYVHGSRGTSEVHSVLKICEKKIVVTIAGGAGAPKAPP